MKKRILGMALVFTMLMSFIPVIANAAEAEGGSCGADGDNVTWRIYENAQGESVLLIEGEGAMADYDYWDDIYAPWDDYRNDIRLIGILDGVTSIGEDAFHGLRNVKEIYIPASVVSIPQGAFNSFFNLETISVDEGNTAYTAEDNVLYNKDMTDMLCYPRGIGGTCTIPDSVTTISCYFGAVEAFEVGSENTVYSSLDGVLFNKAQTELIYYPIGSDRIEYTVPDTVVTIGEDSFSDSILQEITIQDGVTSIGATAFLYCTELTQITIPDSVTSIGNSAFENCESLESVTLNSVETIGRYTFSKCSSLKTAVLGDKVEGIGNCAFEECKALSEITIPDSVTIIGQYAFEGCESLKTITIGSGVKEIGRYAFSNCDNVTDIYYTGTLFGWNNIYIDRGNYILTKPEGSGVELHILGGSIERGECGDNLTWEYNMEDYSLTISGTGDMWDYYEGSFEIEEFLPPWYGTRVDALIIEDGVTSIGNNAFIDCKWLENVTLGSSLETIGRYAFESCFGLEEITIPDSVKSIDDCAFVDCTGLKNIKLGGGLETIGECAFQNCYRLGEITIPDSVKSIGIGAFSECDGLESVTLSNSLETIGGYAFDGCYRLTEIAIPDSVKSIGDNAFYGSGLESVTLGSGLETIGDEAFMICDIKSITIPAGVASIGKGAFGGNYGLREINVDASNQNYMSEDGVLFNKNKTEIIRYPSAKTGTSYEIPDTVTGIAAYAFEHCTTLKEITIPDGVKSIGRSVFTNCYDLEEIIIPGSVENIENFAFNWCTSLKSVTIGSGVKTIGASAFAGCRELTDVTLPDGMEGISQRAFSNCTSLTEITLPKGLTNINEDTFYDCEALTTITIPSTVTRIVNDAFTNCVNLTDVYFTGTQEQWDAIEIGEFGNSSLRDATIHCLGIDEEDTLQKSMVNVVVNGDTRTFEVSVPTPNADSIVYVAVYDNEDNLLSVYSVELDMTKPTVINTTVTGNDSYARVFVWDNNMRPLAEVNKTDLA